MLCLFKQLFKKAIPKYEILRQGDFWAVRCNHGVYAESLYCFDPLATSAFYSQQINIKGCWTKDQTAALEAYERLMA